MNKCFLTESKADFSASESLLKDENYSRALYFFQQSVEKILKFICLEVGAVKFSDTKQLNHNVFNLINKLCKHFQIISNNPELKTIEDQIMEDLNVIQNFKDEGDKVSAVNELITIFSQATPLFKKNENETNIEALNRLTSSFGSEINESDLKLIKNMEHDHPSFVRSKLNDIITLFNVGINMLQLIAIYTFYTNHFKSDSLRYPTQAIESPSTYFNPDNAFIKALPNMLETYNRYVLLRIEEVNWRLIRN